MLKSLIRLDKTNINDKVIIYDLIGPDFWIHQLGTLGFVKGKTITIINNINPYIISSYDDKIGLLEDNDCYIKVIKMYEVN
jgi:hypothetical protein